MAPGIAHLSNIGCPQTLLTGNNPGVGGLSPVKYGFKGAIPAPTNSKVGSFSGIRE